MDISLRKIQKFSLAFIGVVTKISVDAFGCIVGATHTQGQLNTNNGGEATTNFLQ